MLRLQLQDSQRCPEFVTGHAEKDIPALLGFGVDKRIEYHVLCLPLTTCSAMFCRFPGSCNGRDRLTHCVSLWVALSTFEFMLAVVVERLFGHEKLGHGRKSIELMSSKTSCAIDAHSPTWMDNDVKRREWRGVPVTSPDQMVLPDSGQYPAHAPVRVRPYSHCRR